MEKAYGPLTLLYPLHGQPCQEHTLDTPVPGEIEVLCYHFADGERQGQETKNPVKISPDEALHTTVMLICGKWGPFDRSGNKRLRNGE